MKQITLCVCLVLDEEQFFKANIYKMFWREMKAAVSLKKHETDFMVAWALQTRAWITTSALTFVRVVLIFSKQGSWYAEEPECTDGLLLKCIGPYNESILQYTLDVARVMVKANVLVTMIVCILCYKWRSLGNAFIYLEMLLHLSAMFFPNSKNLHATFHFNTYEAFANCASLYTNQPVTIYLYTATLMAINIFGTNIAYGKQLGIKEMVIYALSGVLFFFVFSSIFVTINVVIKLWHRLRFANQENMKLLNNMHEGLLILGKPEEGSEDRPIMFCNQPVQKLLSNCTDVYSSGGVIAGDSMHSALPQTDQSKNSSFGPIENATKLYCFAPITKQKNKKNYESAHD